MRPSPIPLALLALCLFSCSHITRRVTPGEEEALRRNFREAAILAISAKEGRRVRDLQVESFEQTADDEGVLRYRVASEKPLGGGETATGTFLSSVTLKRGGDGVWRAVKLEPGGLTLEFGKGLDVHATPSPPNSPRGRP